MPIWLQATLIPQLALYLMIATAIAGAHAMTVEFEHVEGYPVTVNDAGAAATVLETSAALLGPQAAAPMAVPLMGAEDFAYMLEARPGAFIFCGNGDSAGLHHPAYNFNDEAIVYGTSYWIKLVENTLAA